jgi:hypothetical protein
LRQQRLTVLLVLVLSSLLLLRQVV